MQTEVTEKENQLLKYKPLSDLMEHKSNPFLTELLESGFLEPRKKNIRTEETFRSETTDKVISVPTGILGENYYFKDTRQFIKMFKCDDCFKVIAGFSKPASYLFWSIVEEISSVQPGKKMVVQELIKLSYSKYQKFSGTNSRISYYKAIVELVEYDFLAKFSSDTYYMNINKFVNGDLAKFAAQHLDAQEKYEEKYGKKL